MFAFTRIGADYLTTIGLAVDPQRGSLHVRRSDHPAFGPGNAVGIERGRASRYAVCSHAVTWHEEPWVITMNERRRPGDTGVAICHGSTTESPRRCSQCRTTTSTPGCWTSLDPTAQADRRNARSKMAAGWRGIKSAVRGDSSFFAHCYRGTLIVITAALLGIDQRGWCLIVIGACLVLIAELAHSAVDTLARAIGDPEEPRFKTAREIAAGGVLVAAFGSGPSP